MRPMLIEYTSPMIIGCAPARIGPHRLEIDLPLELRNRPAATQSGNPFLPQSSTMKDALALKVYHGSRSMSISARVFIASEVPRVGMQRIVSTAKAPFPRMMCWLEKAIREWQKQQSMKTC
jgi:hypothetical protein